jgi:hypothetical protein
MRLWDEHLKLGKTSVFVKRDLRVLPLTDAEFEADFFLDRRFSTKRREAWFGIVVERESGDLLALEDVRWPPPTVNDLATLLARAMTRPPHYEDRQRPRVIFLRDRPQWQELLPHLRQLGMEVVLGSDLPRFDEAAVEWIQQDAAPDEPLLMDKIREDFKSPFPKRKRISLDAKLDFLRWTDEMLKAGYPSARKGTPAAYDPLSPVAIPLTLDEIDAILTQTDVARTKKLKPKLEVMREAQRDVELPVNEWGRVIFSLCGAKQEAHVCKRLMKIARKIAERLSEVLGVDAPETARLP